MMTPLLAFAEPTFAQRLFFGDRLPPSETAAWSDALFMMIFWFSVFFFVVLMSLMVIFVIKYRRRPGVPPPPSPHHNSMLEMFWTVVPSSGMLVMFVLGFQGYTRKLVSPDTAMELRIKGQKWSWVATYPNGATSPETQYLSSRPPADPNSGGPIVGKKYPIFYLPEETDVKLRMHSIDVIHSFWIPEFRTKMDVVPNRYTGFGFRTPRLTAQDYYTNQDSGEVMPGRDMWIFCAEYCGDEHSRMAATLRVVPLEVYNQKMEEWGVKGSPIEEGQKIFTQTCASCHHTDGTKLVGPPWNSTSLDGHQFGYGYPATLDDGTTVMRDANYYRESILDPNAKIVAGYKPQMPSYQGQLSDDDIDHLIAFIESLSDRGPQGSGDSTDGGSDKSTDQPAQSQAGESAGSES